MQCLYIPTSQQGLSAFQAASDVVLQGLNLLSGHMSWVARNKVPNLCLKRQ